MDFAYRLAMQHPWAITESALEALVDAYRLSAATGFADAKAAFDDDGFGAPATAKPTGGVGVIQIRGALKQHPSASFFDFLFGGGASYDQIEGQLKAFLADDSVRAIVLDIDSPGGTVYGMSSLMGAIMAARGKKPIVAHANSVAASAAYGIGAAADAFYMDPGGIVGSIGVFVMHEDVSEAAKAAGINVTLISAGKYKTRGNEFAPLSDDDLKAIQARVDGLYQQFTADIARGRGVTPAAVRSGFGEGDVVTATDAKKLGMVDGVMTLAAAIEKAQTIRSKAPGGAAAESTVDEPQADEEGIKRLNLQRWRAQQALAETAKGVS